MAVQDNKIGFIKKLIGKGADLNRKDGDGNTALHLAAKKNNKEIVETLIKAGADKEIENNGGKIAKNITNSQKIKVLLT